MDSLSFRQLFELLYGFFQSLAGLESRDVT